MFFLVFLKLFRNMQQRHVQYEYECRDDEVRKLALGMKSHDEKKKEDEDGNIFTAHNILVLFSVTDDDDDDDDPELDSHHIFFLSFNSCLNFCHFILTSIPRFVSCVDVFLLPLTSSERLFLVFLYFRSSVTRFPSHSKQILLIMLLHAHHDDQRSPPLESSSCPPPSS